MLVLFVKKSNAGGGCTLKGDPTARKNFNDAKWGTSKDDLSTPPLVKIEYDEVEGKVAESSLNLVWRKSSNFTRRVNGGRVGLRWQLKQVYKQTGDGG